MGQHSLVRAAEEVISSEPWWRRYKGSIIIVITGVVAVLTQLAESPDWQGTTTGTVLTVVVSVAGVLVNRFTPDAMTPSMAPRLERVIKDGDAYADR